MYFIPRSIGPIPVDVVVKETIESSLKITERPVEFGADITDHAYVQPKKLVMECIIGGNLATGLSGRAVAIAGYQALKWLQESREPFVMVSGLDIHTNMLIEKLVPERDVNWCNVLKFTVELKEIQIVGSAYVAGAPANAPEGGQARGLTQGALEPGSPEALRASGTVARGDGALQQLSTDATTAEGRANASLISSIFN